MIIYLDFDASAGFPADAQAEIVRRVAGLFARFNVTVQDTPPADMSAGKALHVLIRGNDVVSQAGIGAAFQPGNNQAFVRHLPTWSVYPAGVAAIIAHECGHAFGLRHLIENGDYCHVLPNGDCPIMGTPADAERAVWATGTNELGEPQDDVAMLTQALGLKGLEMTITVTGMKPVTVQLEPA